MTYKHINIHQMKNRSSTECCFGRCAGVIHTLLDRTFLETTNALMAKEVNVSFQFHPSVFFNKGLIQGEYWSVVKVKQIKELQLCSPQYKPQNCVSHIIVDQQIHANMSTGLGI